MISHSRIALALLMALIGAAALCGEDTPSPALLVLSKGDLSLAIVDPATLRVVGRVPSGPDPHEVIASADGKIAYISNYGGGAYNTITVADIIAQKSLPVIDLGPLRGPHGLVFLDGKLWFTAEGAKVIGRYDPAAKKIDWVLGTGQNRTHMVFVSEDLKTIVTANVSSGTMSIIEEKKGTRREDWDETVVPVGRGPEGFDVSPNGKEIWVANAQDGTVSIIDIAGKKVVRTLAANVKSANRLKFTPDGRLVLISSLSEPDLAVFDAATGKTVKRIKIGHGAAGILVESGGARAFVSCGPDNYVAVIDLKTLEVTGHIDAGKNPDGLAWAVRP